MTRSEILQNAKPIFFNTEMIRAIQDGKKTVTRKMMKPQPIYLNGFWWHGAKRWPEKNRAIHLVNGARLYKMPYKPGDYLYVKETWRVSSVKCENGIYAWNCQYKSDMSKQEIQMFDSEKFYTFGDKYFDRNGWIPSIFMPKDAARIFLRVKGLRAEMLQEIDGDGILAEGMDNGKSNPTMGKRWENMQRMKFENLWNSTIKPKDLDKYGWDANPWVWVTEFEQVEVE